MRLHVLGRYFWHTSVATIAHALAGVHAVNVRVHAVNVIVHRWVALHRSEIVLSAPLCPPSNPNFCPWNRPALHVPMVEQHRPSTPELQKVAVAT